MMRLGDCLEILPTLEENSAHAVICDPPYFLINNSGTGFMSKDWDGIISLWKYLWLEPTFVKNAGRILREMQAAPSMDAEFIAQESVNIHQEKDGGWTAQSAQIPLRCGSVLKKHSALHLVITEQELSDLLGALLGDRIKIEAKSLIGEKKSALFVIPISWLIQGKTGFARASVLKRLMSIECVEGQTRPLLMEGRKTKDAGGGRGGTKSGEEYTNATDGDAKCADLPAEKKKSNAIILSHTESVELTRLITLSLFASDAIPSQSGYNQRLVENFYRVWAREVIRVARPGAYLLAFGGTRTYHRIACAIEDAGWIIRDTLMWCYGSGFPKSHDVSKAIDKAAGKEREVVGQSRSGFGKRNGKTDADGGIMHNSLPEELKIIPITAPATPEAEQWNGWGTALKPAYEPIILAQKPLEGTYAQNLIKWGCGALNIDASRIGVDTISTHHFKGVHDFNKGRGIKPYAQHQGRWPANILFQHNSTCEVVGEAEDGYAIKVYEGRGPFGESMVDKKYNGRAVKGKREIYRCSEGGFINTPFITIREEAFYLTDSIDRLKIGITLAIAGARQYSEARGIRSLDRHNLRGYDEMHALGLSALPSFRVCCPACRRSCDGLVRVFRDAAQAPFPRLFDVLDNAFHLFEQLHSHCRPRPARQSTVDVPSPSLPYSHTAESKISEHDFSVLNELAKTFSRKLDSESSDSNHDDSHNNMRGNKNGAADFSYRSGMIYHTACIDTAFRVLACVSFDISSSLGYAPVYHTFIEKSTCAVAMLDRQSGESGSTTTKTAHYNSKSGFGGGQINIRHPDSGGASRFFYCTKVSPRERNAGTEELFWVNRGGKNERIDKQAYNALEEENIAAELAKTDKPHKISKGCHHPTLKPLSLLRYLARLVCPPGGAILDPFMGSGSMGCAAAIEGFDYIGIEREAAYHAIAEKRIAHWSVK